MPRADYEFHHRFRVRYSEIDGQGIVFNAHYLTYIDTAITEYFRALPYDYKGETEKSGIDFHTVRSLVEYAKPAAFDEEIDVCVKVGRIGRSSIRFDIEIHGCDAEDLRITGQCVWVYTNQTTHATEPVDPRLVQLMIAMDGEAIKA